MSKHYPKWKYSEHKEHPFYEGKIVHSQEQEKALGAGWHDSPADFGIVTHPQKGQAHSKPEEHEAHGHDAAIVEAEEAPKKRRPGRPRKE